MTINREIIYYYAAKFRKALDHARVEPLLSRDIVFRSFPRGCCGDTCYLLAEYLRKNDIETIYVVGEDGDQSHAWLVVKDNNILPPTPNTTELPEHIRVVLSNYSGKQYGTSIVNVNYTENDIEEGLIIDITADQFDQSPVYVDYLRSFHKRFEFVHAHDYDNLDSSRLKTLFKVVMKYI